MPSKRPALEDVLCLARCSTPAPPSLPLQVVDPGNFSRASEDVLKQRKIVRARRGAAPAGGDAAAKANPFAGIQLTGAAPAPAANPFAGVSLLGGAAAPAATPAPTPAKAAPAEGQEQPAATEQPAAVEAKQEAAAPAAAKAAQQPVDAAPAAEQQVADESKATPAEQAKPAAEEKPATEAAKPTGGFGGLGSTSGLAFGSSGFGAASGGFGSLGECMAGGWPVCCWLAVDGLRSGSPALPVALCALWC